MNTNPRAEKYSCLFKDSPRTRETAKMVTKLEANRPSRQFPFPKQEPSDKDVLRIKPKGSKSHQGTEAAGNPWVV